MTTVSQPREQTDARRKKSVTRDSSTCPASELLISFISELPQQLLDNTIFLLPSLSLSLFPRSKLVAPVLCVGERFPRQLLSQEIVFASVVVKLNSPKLFLSLLSFGYLHRSSLKRKQEKFSLKPSWRSTLKNPQIESIWSNKSEKRRKKRRRKGEDEKLFLSFSLLSVVNKRQWFFHVERSLRNRSKKEKRTEPRGRNKKERNLVLSFANS